MLDNYVNKNKNIIIVGGTKIGRQKVLLEAVNLIDIKERIIIVEKTFEIPKERLFNDNCRTSDIKFVQTSELSIDRIPQNAVAVSFVDDVSYITKHILPNSKYTIMACDKLTNELNPYADIVVQLKDNDTIDIIKEKSE